MALALSSAGFQVILHSGHSQNEAGELVAQINALGGNAKFISADFSDPQNSLEVFSKTFKDEQHLFALINNAAIFEPGSFIDTTYESWMTHFSVNLTMPFLISQAFAKKMRGNSGRIVNILDWRALRPGKDHFAYTITKAALASMTQAMAVALAPKITVNGLALGAILPPSDDGSEKILHSIPLGRWAEIKEVTDTVLFLLTGPEYITGEIIHLDGGRHLI